MNNYQFNSIFNVAVVLYNKVLFIWVIVVDNLKSLELYQFGMIYITPRGTQTRKSHLTIPRSILKSRKSLKTQRWGSINIFRKL